MASFVKFNCFPEDLALAVHDLSAGGDTIMVYLTNTQPLPGTHALLVDLPGISEGNGYAAADIENDLSESSGTASLTGVDITFTAAGGSFGPFRYLVIYNSTTSVKANPLIGYYDYGSAITVAAGETFVVDVGTSILTIS